MPHIMVESEGITEDVEEWRTDVAAKFVRTLGLDRCVWRWQQCLCVFLGCKSVELAARLVQVYASWGWTGVRGVIHLVGGCRRTGVMLAGRVQGALTAPCPLPRRVPSIWSLDGQMVVRSARAQAFGIPPPSRYEPQGPRRSGLSFVLALTCTHACSANRNRSSQFFFLFTL